MASGILHQAGTSRLSPFRVSIPFMLLFALSSCVNEQSNFVMYPNDPIARSNGASSIATGSTYDAGITLERSQIWSGSPAYSTAHAAFEKKSSPAEVASVSINNTNLNWANSTTGLFYAQSYGVHDLATYGAIDSVEFSYSGFDGTAFSTRSPFHDFGKFSAPDTVVISQGFTLRYEHAYREDSLMIVVQTYDSIAPNTLHALRMTVPDSGLVVFKPGFIIPSKNTDGLVIQISRSHFRTIVTPEGKRIGVSTIQQLSPTVISMRP